MTSDQFQPLQLKGEIMDLEFTMDTDHRQVQVALSLPLWSDGLSSLSLARGEGTGQRRVASTAILRNERYVASLQTRNQQFNNIF